MDGVIEDVGVNDGVMLAVRVLLAVMLAVIDDVNDELGVAPTDSVAVGEYVGVWEPLDVAVVVRDAVLVAVTLDGTVGQAATRATRSVTPESEQPARFVAHVAAVDEKVTDCDASATVTSDGKFAAPPNTL